MFVNKKVKILVADGNNDYLPILVKCLENELGADVEYASSGKGCMEKLDQNGYDGLVVKYRLSGMTDLKLLKNIREQHEDIALIVLFDPQDEKIVGDCIKSGADDYVTRTSECLTVLPVVINQALQKRELIKSERMLRRELVRQNRFSSMGKLMQGIGHNLNSPLSGIMGRAQLCIEREERGRRELLTMKDTMPPEEFEKQMKRYEINLRDLNSINESALRLSLIVKNMTYKGQQEQNEKVQYLNLNDLLREELSFLEADMFFKHEVTKRFELAESLPHIKGIYSDFSQGLITIVQNALEAMRSAEKKELIVSTSCNGRSISVKIHHTVPRMSEEEINPLPSLSSEPGVSLNTALELLKPYGVHVSFASPPGYITVTIKIPCNREKS